MVSFYGNLKMLPSSFVHFFMVSFHGNFKTLPSSFVHFFMVSFHGNFKTLPSSFVHFFMVSFHGNFKTLPSSFGRTLVWFLLLLYLVFSLITMVFRVIKQRQKRTTNTDEINISDRMQIPGKLGNITF